MTRTAIAAILALTLAASSAHADGDTPPPSAGPPPEPAALSGAKVAEPTGAAAAAAGNGDDGDHAATARHRRGPRAEGAPGPSRRQNSAAEVARDGTFLPGTIPARIGDHYVAALALGGYDGADAGGGRFTGFVEGAIVNRLAVRVSTDFSSLDAGNTRLAAGVRFGVLRQEQHKIDLGVFAQYRNKGYTESRGEIELTVAVGRRWGNLGVYGNVTYGQGFEEHERDGELSLAALYAVHPRVNVGIDARARFDLGEASKPADPSRKDRPFDLVAGPVATAAFGPIALVGQAGLHTVLLDLPGGGERVSTGLVVLAGAGATY